MPYLLPSMLSFRLYYYCLARHGSCLTCHGSLRLPLSSFYLASACTTACYLQSRRALLASLVLCPPIQYQDCFDRIRTGWPKSHRREECMHQNICCRIICGRCQWIRYRHRFRRLEQAAFVKSLHRFMTLLVIIVTLIYEASDAYFFAADARVRRRQLERRPLLFAVDGYRGRPTLRSLESIEGENEVKHGV
ncbi:hypothetical protein DENSPDRAFT_79356 [Dentipellis sp. KUC8613]|nr:hypothetical protein DENSPDRAFT_79356 [Dentipellis sp. KUC8613]